LRIADHCYVINKGEVFFHGTAEQVRNHREVQRTYLGDDNAKPTHGSTGLHDGTHDGNEADFDDELNDEDDGVDPPGDKFYPGRGRAAGHDNAGHGNATPNAAPHSRLPGGAAPSGHSGGSVPVTTPHSRRATNANSSDRG
jgi:hypothetical protein